MRRLLRDSTLLDTARVARAGERRLGPSTDHAIVGPSEIQMGNGETYAFDFEPTAAGDLHLDVMSAAGVLLASMPIRAR